LQGLLVTTRQDLLTHWDQQLTLAEEEELASATWRQRIRQRLYRFLLAMYGGANWSGSPEDAEEVSLHPTALLVTEEAELPDASNIDELEPPGKAPRTRAEIIRGLKNVRGLSDELAPPGPLQHGLPPNAPMAVASCKKRLRAERLMGHLIRGGFAPRLAYRSQLFQVFVAAANAPAAIQFLQRVEVTRPRITQQLGRAASARIRTTPSWIGVLAFGGLGIFLTCYVIYLLIQFSINPQQHPLPAPDRFGVLLAATGIVDVMCGFFLWQSWRECAADECQNGPPEDSLSK
jgi:hypothetical protein